MNKKGHWAVWVLAIIFIYGALVVLGEYMVSDFPLKLSTPPELVRNLQ